MANKFTPDPLKWPSFESVEVIERHANPDLAVLRVVTDSESKNLPEPMVLPSKCDFQPGQILYGIGYPGTLDRIDPAAASIAYKDELQKRWSRGVFVGTFSDQDVSDPERYFGTTIDALHGNSGGPVLNTEGTLVGILLKVSSKSKDHGYKYVGNESSDRLDWHSLSVRCEYLQNLKLYFENESSK